MLASTYSESEASVGLSPIGPGEIVEVLEVGRIAQRWTDSIGSRRLRTSRGWVDESDATGRRLFTPARIDGFTFTRDGSIGILLSERANGRAGETVLEIGEIEAGSAAAEMGGLQLGLVLSKVQDDNVLGHGLGLVVEKIRSQSRPLRLSFQLPVILPERDPPPSSRAAAAELSATLSPLFPTQLNPLQTDSRELDTSRWSRLCTSRPGEQGVRARGVKA